VRRALEQIVEQDDGADIVRVHLEHRDALRLALFLLALDFPRDDRQRAAIISKS